MRSVETNGLTPLEIASHVLLGRDETADDAEPAGRASVRSALEASLLAALRRPRCVIAFSGGRDSSALLAVATQVARREGLPQPVPATLLFQGAPQTQEADWQTLVIRHLGVSDWIRRDVADELDLVGPTAEAIMSRDGLPYPYNLHLLAPLIEEAGGGSFVSGLGGDQVLHPAKRPHDVLARRARPSGRDAARIVVGIGPRALRRSVLRSRVGLTFPWLRADANALLSRAWLEDQVGMPFRWSQTLRELSRSRFMRMTIRRIARLGASADVAVHHPFADAGFVHALAREGGATGFGSRTAAMEALFSDVLPGELIGRPTKGTFDEVLWNRHTRAFVAGMGDVEVERALAGLGLDRVVDPRALAEHWAAEAPMANSFLLLQACWLALRCEPAPAAR